jgi:hypothetical protein
MRRHLVRKHGKAPEIMAIEERYPTKCEEKNAEYDKLYKNYTHLQNKKNALEGKPLMPVKISHVHSDVGSRDSTTSTVI